LVVLGVIGFAFSQKRKVGGIDEQTREPLDAEMPEDISSWSASATRASSASAEIRPVGNVWYSFRSIRQERPKLMISAMTMAERQSWSRLSEQNLRVDKWSICRG
jgi:hypothetical protein